MILCSVSRVRVKTMHLCSALRHKSYLVHYLMLHRFEIHSALELSRKALLGCHLAASRLREAARWQLTLKSFAKLIFQFWNRLTKNENYQGEDQ